MSPKYDHFEARACAKFNLSLAITGRRGNLHTLDMIVCPCEEFADEARFVPRGAQGEAGLILQEVSARFDGFKPDEFQKFFVPKIDKISKYLGISGDIYLKKGVPLGAGLGGSSAATVAVLKAVGQYLSSTGKAGPVSNEFLLSLGSDVPCMYLGGVCRVQGVGDIVTPLPCPPPKAKIFIPNCSSDSAECYALYDKLVAQGMFAPPSAIPATVDEALAVLRNDLELPATTLHPEIGDMLNSLRAQYDKVIMSGSGSACACILR